LDVKKVHQVLFWNQSLCHSETKAYDASVLG
jgi:hypothetical protein